MARSSSQDPPPERLQSANRARGWRILYRALGVVEVAVQPALGLVVVNGLEQFVSPLPRLTLDPFAITFAGGGLLLTQFLEGVIVLGLLVDLAWLYRADRRVPPDGGGDGE